MPVLARTYGLTPSDVWALTNPELEAFLKDLEALSG